MNTCSHFISLCNPFSARYDALQDFEFLEKKEQILVGTLTGVVAVLTLPFFCLLAVLAFRCLVTKFSAKDMNKDKTENVQLQIEIEKVKEEGLKFFSPQQVEKPNPEMQPQKIAEVTLPQERLDLKDQQQALLANTPLENEIPKDETLSKQENTLQTVDKINDKPQEIILEKTPDLPEEEKVIIDEPKALIIKNEPEPQNPQRPQRFTEEQIQILRDLNSPIIDAIVDQNLDKLKELIEQGADLEEDCALHWAACQGNLDIVKLLVENHANIDSKDDKGATPLHEAIELNNLEVAKYLLNQGADPNICDDQGVLPLHFAADRGFLEIATLLLDKTPIDSKDHCGVTVLGYAAIKGQKDMVNFLVERGADVNAGGVEGRLMISKLPWHWAAEFGQLEVLQILRNKIDIDVTDDKNWTALLYATAQGHIEVVRFLLEEEADPKIGTIMFGLTPLHIAATKGDIQIVELLINKVDVDFRDSERFTPLSYAAMNGHKEVVQLLVAKGADIQSRDEKGKTPLDYATQNGHLDIIELLTPK